MEDKKEQILSQQSRMLTQLQAGKIPVGIYLKTGIKILGVIVAFDAHVIILHSPNLQQMIYKHAISTVVPQIG